MKNNRLKRNSKTNNTAYFDESSEMYKRNTFSRREVGLTHPDTSSFIKLNDRGEIEIFAGEELGIVISPTTRSISIFADVVKFVTKEDYGLRWNNKSFNYASDTYSEPAVVNTSIKEINSGFNFADYFLNAVESIDTLEKENNITTILTEYEFGSSSNVGQSEAQILNLYSEISSDNVELLRNYAQENSAEKVEYMKKLLESGFTFSQAKEKTERDKG